jgi:methylisocitrate lyase
MVEKIRAAAAARQDFDLVLIARTDARAVEGFDAAIERAKRYVEAGADAIFPEALETRDEFERFAAALPGVPLLANMTEFGKSPLLPATELGAMGYRMVIYPMTLVRVAMHAAEALLPDLKKEGTQAAWLDRMQTRAALYDMLDYDGLKARDAAARGD